MLPIKDIISHICSFKEDVLLVRHLSNSSKMSQEEKSLSCSGSFQNPFLQEPPSPPYTGFNCQAKPQSFLSERDLEHNIYKVYPNPNKESLSLQRVGDICYKLSLCHRRPMTLGSVGLKKRIQNRIPNSIPILLSNQPKFAQGQSELQNTLNHLLSQKKSFRWPWQTGSNDSIQTCSWYQMPKGGKCPILDLKIPKQVL